MDEHTSKNTSRNYFGSTVSLQDKNQATIYKLNRLRELGYQVVSMWECEFR